MEPIAIIGMSAIFPQAHNLQDYWDNILNEIDCITDVPSSRWEIDDYYNPNPKEPDKSYSKRGGFIPDIDFDPLEFGLPPNILEATDVSQLLALVAAKSCLEDGGYGDSAEISRENVGVILGMVGVGSKLMVPLMARLQYPVWDKVLKSYGISTTDRQAIIEKIKLAYPKWEENSFPGSIGNVVAGRIANRFDLGGTNCVIDAACASSLAAIRMAVGELVNGHADMMISGGVDTDNSIGAYLCFSKTPAFTKGEKIRPFDKDSDGMLVGEGIGMILMKRLTDAQRDGDRVYAVIKGVGSSSDGRYKSIYAPRADGQSLALRRAYAQADFDPSTVGLIDAHGTGTVAGDPAEFEGLNTVFSADNNQKQYIALGSVKSQIGHTKAAAGVASLIKSALALHNKILPATINVTQPNPKLGIENSPFYINTECQPWINPIKHPRRAGVSSFGFGGTNFHVVLEEASVDHINAYRTHTTGQMILLSAPDQESLLAECDKWKNKLDNAISQNVFFELVEQSITQNPPVEYARVGFVAIDSAETLKLLSDAIDLMKLNNKEISAEHPKGIYYREQGIHPDAKVVALFPGQGSQFVNMGSHIAMNFPEVRQAYSTTDTLFSNDNLLPLSKTVYPVPVFSQSERDEQNQKLTETKFAQPAIGTYCLGLYKILQNAGFKPDFIAGHSFGELTALWAANVYQDEDFLFLAKSRGEAMAPLSDPEFDAGTMLAVKGDLENLTEELKTFPDISIANLNSNNQVVLAGSKSAIAEVQKSLVEKGYAVIPLEVSAAFHTPLVSHAQEPFAAAINSIKFKKPKTPVFSNSTGNKYPSDPASIQKILKDHILKSVNFKDEIENIYSSGGLIFVEIGPKSVLTNLVNNILSDKPHVTVALNTNPKGDSDRQLRQALTKLCVLGLPLHKFDPYSHAIIPQSEDKASPIRVKLNGGLYLSNATKLAFQNAINQQDTLDYHKNGQTNSKAPKQEPQELPTKFSLPSETPSQPVKDLSSELSGVQSIQQDTLTIHNKFLENEVEYSRIFNQLTQQELELLNGKSSHQDLEQINIAMQTLDHSISQFHQHHAETTRIHEDYLKNQADLLNNLLNLHQGNNGHSIDKSTGPSHNLTKLTVNSTLSQEIISQPLQPTETDGNERQSRSSVSKPVPEPNDPIEQSHKNIDTKLLSTALLEIVSEKTGYPPEMLEMEMDMEADLGIDSIKRVEILGAMQIKFPDLPQIDPSALSELRTLGEIIDYMSQSAENLAGSSQISPSANQVTEVSGDDKVIQGSTTSIVEVQAVMLKIVSEKTGYPSEMLEMEMDMEADLGIDSIKRVEILGAMQGQFPELPQADTGRLAEMRTLAEIVAYMSSHNQHDPTTVAQSLEKDEDDPTEATHRDQTPETVKSTIDLDEITTTLLLIASEKTGYPTEMLDLDMDFEADLGIDSIKKVEILGTVQEQYPELSKIDASSLTDLRTLQEIIDLFNQQTSPDTLTSEESNQDEAQPKSLGRSAIAVQSIPFPDRLTVKSLPDHATLIVNDGSTLTKILVEKLTDLNDKIIVLSLPESLVPENPDLPDTFEQVNLNDISETTIQSTIKGIEDKYGPISVFIHLDPAKNGSKPFSEIEKNIVKTIFLTAKYLKDSLTDAGKIGYAAFLTAIHLDGQFGLSLNTEVEPISGGLLGLTKSLNLEWEDVFCRTIDLAPELDNDLAADHIAAELFDPNQLISEVAYNKEGRFTLTVQEQESGIQA